MTEFKSVFLRIIFHLKFNHMYKQTLGGIEIHKSLMLVWVITSFIFKILSKFYKIILKPEKTMKNVTLSKRD